MGIRFPPDVDDLNTTDLDILRCLYRQGPLWKMEITRHVNRQRDQNSMLVERKDSITKQAVSKRVERLHELGYLQSAIIAPGSTDAAVKPDRDFIEGYDLEPKGREALETITKKVLRDTVSSVVDGGELDGFEQYLRLYSDLLDEEVDSLEEFVRLET